MNQNITQPMKNEEELKNMLIHGMKELGEICEVVVKKDRPEHWKNELGDLCAFSIKPMLDLANISFENAIEIGLRRKKDKIKEDIIKSEHK